ncbi:MAG TPA: M48 family metalloprotease [Verrucomicrobiae bacterium]|jgi:Zn-dependent protease with chaperone function|nr:M48 family metalloprotease [Verrucomicrobiae bacterium]
MPFLAMGAFLVGLAITLAVNGIGLSRWNATKNAHWTERARKLYPIRRSAALNLWLIPALCGVAEWAIFPAGRDPAALFVVVSASWLGARIATYPFDKRLFPQFSFRSWSQSVLAGWILRFGMLAPLIAAAVIMPEEMDWSIVAIGAVVLGFQIALHYGLWMWMGAKLRLFELASESDPIATIVRRTSEQMNISYRRIWRLRSPVGYAAALPITRDLIFSEGLLCSHPEEEIAAICAHELAHLNEPPGIRRARLISGLGLFPMIFVRPMYHLFDFVGVALLWLPSSLLTVYIRRLGRRMEVRADSIAGKSESNSGVYAQALERLYQNNHVPAVMHGNRQMHPHLYDRMLAAGITPSYERPKPPATVDWSSGLMIFLFVILFVTILAQQQ